MLVPRPLPAFSDNYIWTLADGEGRALIVDPGDAAPVIEAAQAGLKPVAILLTHHHPDHIGGAAALIEKFNIPCYGPVDSRIDCPMQAVGEGDCVRIDALDLDLQVMEVPGHTTSHIAFHGGGFLFCGDTLFSLGCGRMFEGTPTQFLQSLDRLAALPGEIQVCCGHEYTQSNGRFSMAAEPENAERDRRLAEVADLRARGLPSVPSPMSSERACNPFLRVDQPGLRAGLEARGVAPGDRIAAFAALRSWKDGF